MPRITRRLEFDAGHKVLGHEGKCANVHGHRYVALITVENSALDSIGRVIDFSVVKQKVGGWIDDKWDHTLLLNVNDPIVDLSPNIRNILCPYKPIYLMPSNPTAENMAEHLYRIASDLLREDGITVTKVCIYETPNCSSEFEPVVAVLPKKSK